MTSARDFLLAVQNGDGGWGYKRGGMSFVEPTAAVLMALANDAGAASACQRAHDYLVKLQRPDGGWGIAALDDESGWMTAWATWALARPNPARSERGVAWLLRAEGLRVTNPADVARLKQLLGIDPTLTGWSWQPGDAAWIFPTALSLIALARSGLGDHARVQQGVQYLLDRAIPTGGWNIGNPFMVTGSLPPTVINTAIALMALDACGVADAKAEWADAWLNQYLGGLATAQELAWIAWSRVARRQDNSAILSQLLAQQGADGSWDGNPFTIAVAIMAGAGSHAKI